MTYSLTVILLLIALASIASILFFHWRTGVPPLPTTRSEANDAIALLHQAKLPEQAVIYELGCGWGSLAIALAKAFPQSQIRGIELSPIPYWIARFRTRRMKNVILKRGNFYDCDLRDADAVTCYLMIRPMLRLADFLDKMLRPGAAVVTVTFWFRNRKARAIRKGKGWRGEVALYLWPANKEQE